MKRQFGRFVRKFKENWDNDYLEEDFCYPDADIIDQMDNLVIRFDMPGVNKEDIKLKILSDTVEVRAEKTDEEEEDENDYYLSERVYKGFYRKISLPSPILPEEATAKFKNGVLEITAPKDGEDYNSIEIDGE